MLKDIEIGIALILLYIVYMYWIIIIYPKNCTKIMYQLKNSLLLEERNLKFLNKKK
jgi:hypothetical protein